MKLRGLGLVLAAWALACGALVTKGLAPPGESNKGARLSDAPSMNGASAGAAADASTASVSGSSDASAVSTMPPMPNCAPGGPGLTDCGESHESCCTSLPVPGGTFYRTYKNTGHGPTGKADPATVSSFRLDKYLVTVGRFRQFVNARLTGYVPQPGSGTHAYLNGGKGLANVGRGRGYERGWDTSWNAEILSNMCGDSEDPEMATWTPSAGTQENLPINCAYWYEGYAFCIWDGGFLPSEAEWEYAAAGGSQQREYPWGTADPGTENRYAIYGCHYPSGAEGCSLSSSIAPVGTATQGAARWGQLDMTGELAEWNLDWMSGHWVGHRLWSSYPYVNPCIDCAYLTVAPWPDSYPVFQGAGFDMTTPSAMRASGRLAPPSGAWMDPTVGFRCARSP